MWFSRYGDITQDDSHTTTRFETYVPVTVSPAHQHHLPRVLHQWWRPAASSEQSKAESAAAKGKIHSVNPRGSDDFAAYPCAKSVLEDAKLELVCRLKKCDMAIHSIWTSC